ncbi:MAG: DUF2911 domain-containing protein [Cyclobacteriaceae bacterium]|nr:DUF2911 domain-containing protein [Cyclobacteriaceae bacterium]MDW8331407.1 DUF2911 domain-containing protein [Cyclobacteriaceae bacterium]
MSNAKWIFVPLFFVCSLLAYAQESVRPRPSPLAIASVRYKDTYVKITYSRPQKRGREIFGKLVPYDEVWRTGANEATEITTTRDLIVNGVLLTAGTYSLFTIPRKEQWTIIVNKDVGLWGAYNYNPKMDILRFDVKAQSVEPPVESFTIQFEQKNNTADLILMWDTVKVVIPVQFIEPKS